tara:strand:- start:260 stop:484 length:225 start_codon:yes stop_codon:yes gene_type:complete
MARTRKTKVCSMTGLNFPVTEFYTNTNTKDGLHPYSKKADNFRRRLQDNGLTIGVNQLRSMFNNLTARSNGWNN